MGGSKPVHGFLLDIGIPEGSLKICLESNKSPEGLVGKTLLVTDFSPHGSRPFLHVGQGVGNLPVIVMVEGLVDKKIKVDRVQPGLGCLCLSIILIGVSDADLSDPQTGGGRGRGSSRGSRYIQHSDCDWQWVFLWQEKTRGKARPFVKNTGVRLSLQYCSSNNTTWMGDTHVETNVLLMQLAIKVTAECRSLMRAEDVKQKLGRLARE